MANNSNGIDWSTAPPPPDDGHGHDTHKGDLSTIGPKTVGVCWMLVTLSALFLGSRLWVKLRSHGRMWWDDHLLLASWVSLLLFSLPQTPFKSRIKSARSLMSDGRRSISSC
jgi:hypothetical protein